MKQVININFQGQVVPIEVSALELLKSYTESLHRHFANEESKDEIINDIENRIGELFQERLKKGATCITDDDVNAIITSMGRPEDFDSADEKTSAASFSEESDSKKTQQDTTATHKRLYRDENNKVFGGVCSGIANFFGISPTAVRILIAIFFVFTIIPYFILWIALPSSASIEIGGVRKKLYRDGDDKIIAGVCSGLGNYFGIHPWIPRTIFLVPFLSFVFHNSHFPFYDFGNFFKISFSPGTFLFYIILWLVIPEANTTAEKLEMKGEKVDLNSIKNTVTEEMKGVKDRAQKFGKEARAFATEKGKTISSEISGGSRRTVRSLGDFIVLLVKIVAYFIIGVVSFALVIALFAVALVAVAIFPLKDFMINNNSTENWLAWGTLIFFIAVPVIGIITWLIRRLAKIRSNSRIMRLTFICLWVIGWACFIFLIADLSKNFKYTNDMVEQNMVLQNPTVAKLEFTAHNDLANHNYRRRFVHFSPFDNIQDEDSFYENNVHFRILKSTNDSFHVSIIKLADGKTRQEAESAAAAINYNFTQEDTLIKMPFGIQINKLSKFRNQHVIVSVYVPVGKRIRINQNVWDDNSEEIHFGINDDYNWDDYWGDEEHGWTTNVDYIQKADGLYRLDGESADGSKKRAEFMDDLKERRLDSLEQLKDKIKDSIEKEIEKKINKEKEKIEKENMPAAYMKPTGLSVINSFM